MYLDIATRSSSALASPERASRAEVRNPLLTLPSASRAGAMPPAARDWLIDFLQDFRRDAQQRAAKCLRTHKAPMYLYFKVLAVYSGHLARLLRATRKRAT